VRYFLTLFLRVPFGRHAFVMASTMMLATAAHADWSLDNARSQLNFVSIKAANIAEVHRFNRLSGRVTDRGQASLTVDLSSVMTNIDIRDERMREHLFDVLNFPSANLSTEVDIEAIKAMASGTEQVQDITGELIIKGKATPLNASLRIAKLDADTVVVSSQQPIIVYANALDLSAGIEKLRELAGLPSISQAVPITFSLTYVIDAK